MQKLNNPLRKIVVVFKTHFDFGFTGLPDEVMSLYVGEMFSAVRRVMDATAAEPEGLRYAWTLPSWPLKYLLHDPLVPPETQRAAHDLVTQGRLHWHAWPFTTHTAFCGLEELVRGLHFSHSLAEEFGRGTIAAKQTDVPGHTWILPTLLTGAGVKFLHLGVNPGSHSPHVPTLFWWEGPDGSRLLTWYSHGGYGSTLLPPDDWPLDTWLAVLLTVENTGPQSPEELQQIRAFIEKNAPGVEVVFGQLDDFAHSVLARPEQLAELPVVPYDLADTWIHGIGTMPREVARVRELRSRILALELQAASLDWPHDTSDTRQNFKTARAIAPHIDRAYEQLLLFGEHTWGLDVKSTIKRAFGPDFEEARQTDPYRRLESSWTAKAAYVDNAESAYDKARRTGGTGIVHLPKHSPTLPTTLSNPPTPDAEPTLQAFGAPIATTPYSIRIGHNQNVIENNYLRVEVDPKAGGITSLIEKVTNHDWELLSPKLPLGAYRYDIYSAQDIGHYLQAYGTLFQDWFVQDQGKSGYPENTPHITAYARNFTLRNVNRSSNGGTLLLSDGTLETNADDTLTPAQNVSLKISLYDTVPFLDIEYSIKGKIATPLAESGMAEFALNLQKPTFRIGQAGSVIDPTRDIAAGANRHLWCADWLDTSDDRAGISVIPIDMPLLSIGDPAIYRFEPGHVSTEPTIYAHFFNTQWGTNFRQWHEGDFIFRVRLYPHTGDWRIAETWRASLHAMDETTPFSPVENTPTQLPIRASDGLVLTTIHPRKDRPGIIARFWDALGLARQAHIEVDGPVQSITLCDLMERPAQALKTKQHDGGTTLDFHTAPHAITTLLIEFKDQM